MRSCALDTCIKDVSSDDLLVSLASLEILAEVAESSTAAASGLKSIAALTGSLIRVASNRLADIALRTRALIVGGRIAATSTSDSDAFVLDMMRLFEALFDEGERDVRSAIIDASGAMCVSQRAIADFYASTSPKLVHTMAFNAFRGTGESQIVALHALANVCGAERDADSEMLSEQAEAVIADACFSACGSKSIGEYIHGMIALKSDHFLPARCGAYRLLSTLGKRRAAAEEIAAHAPTRRALCDEYERVSIAATHRIAAIKALHAANVSDVAARDHLARALAAPRASARPPAVPDVRVSHR